MLFCTDPPYYDSVPYAEISDYFYVWLRETVPQQVSSLFTDSLTPKVEQAIVWHPNSKDEAAAYLQKMANAMRGARTVTKSSGIGIVVFAHKSTVGWEAQLASMIHGGWTITGSWPIDTERGGRFNSQQTAALASSVHLVCRPRSGSDVGDWRDVLTELPVRMHEWMPRLASEGVVGADAIFACLGPALEIFSRYARVEKSNGEVVPLGDVKDEKGVVITEGYLSHVWAAVSKEAISTIFRDADATGLEPDARLTAVWLWTLGNARDPSAPAADSDTESADEPEDDEDEDAGGKAKKGAKKGFILEFDAARKIAQGLGIHLEQSGSVVEVKGESARLLPVSERTAYLFGKAAAPAGEKAAVKKRKAAPALPGMEAEPEPSAKVAGVEITAAPPGVTVLDRLHQAMILFGAQRGELLKRFLVDDGAGQDARLWKLAQALAALYPPSTDERRWVEGVLARKKGLGL